MLTILSRLVKLTILRQFILIMALESYFMIVESYSDCTQVMESFVLRKIIGFNLPGATILGSSSG